MKRIALAFLSALAACATTAPRGAEASFDMRHQLAVNVPEGAKQVRIWFVEPQQWDREQRISQFQVDCAHSWRRVKDSEGNSYIFVELANPKAGKVEVVNRCAVTRREVHVDADPAKTRPHTAAELKEMSKHLGPNTHIVIDDRIRALAARICGGEQNPVVKGRLIYDWVLGNVEYWVKDPDRLKASPVGSSTYCLENATGNCTDFHSLYAAIARAANLPTRMVYGSFFKGPLNGVDQDQSYHCWIEFHAPGIGWVPLDVAVADIFVKDVTLNEKNEPKIRLTTADGYHGPDAAMVDYYFANLEARRVTWSRGRDLSLDPRQAGGPVNMMAKAYVEIDGKPSSDYERKLTFTDVK